MCWSPHAIWQAFLKGRQGRSTYATETTQEFLESPLRDLQAEFAPEPRRAPGVPDFAAFCYLLLQAFLLLFATVVLVFVLLLPLAFRTVF